MTMRALTLPIGALLAGLAISVTPAQALTMKECSAKYKEAQTANTLNGQKWNDFRKANCGSDATATPAATPAAAPAAAPAKPATEAAAPAKPAKTAAKPAAAAPAGSGNAVFPSAVDQKYSKETEGKARMHTCLDQYNANKANNGNGELKWIQKGGGYYSECNKRLKGA
ncbi:hypothetical protein [Rhodoplanes sp. Z2-YC6860]|uniref:hypothetical protein n=1 Tax=Rhodoplanes sp. Z2-YC6860 TaxID=674703 RepID=UPI00078CD101|nr:hypothetical protein [Rhodoplanes sp. Z2-YC6860]AMN40107.1 hypothetical protein RHPLAN_16520 [Rhodoplanes sp. Z2-YC6860]